MSYISIKGRRPLRGEVSVQGSKNAVLPILAASLLAVKGKTRIIGCPDITDVECMAALLVELGCDVSFNKGIIEIDAENAVYKDLTQDIVGGARGSVLMAGALLGRFHKAVISYPGGCAIGQRKINYHIDVMKELGADFCEEFCRLCLNASKLAGCYFHFPDISVGATENALLSAVLAEGTTTLTNVAVEPEIMALIEFLNASGAKIRNIGKRTLVIEGVKQLTGTEYRLPPDRIVAGTYMTAIAASGGNAVIHNVIKEQQEGLMEILSACGCSFNIYGTSCEVISTRRPAAVNLITSPYPGFPTDMQSQVMALLTAAEGKSIITEMIFEDRFRIIDELTKMGAMLTTNVDKVQTVEINGIKQLKGTNVCAKDLRGGAALCIAGLMAEGETIISGVHFIQRGYEDICRDLRMLGADICHVKDNIDEIESIGTIDGMPNDTKVSQCMPNDTKVSQCMPNDAKASQCMDFDSFDAYLGGILIEKPSQETLHPDYIIHY